MLPKLAILTGEHPTRQRLVGIYPLALHRAGRTAVALDLYTRVRVVLANTLGLEPDPALRQTTIGSAWS